MTPVDHNNHQSPTVLRVSARTGPHCRVAVAVRLLRLTRTYSGNSRVGRSRVRLAVRYLESALTVGLYLTH